ncbi:hypothetical protein SLEP1_g41430 [Rubroshorea leprosula]|uniref:Uncharacterized protein n=1 Tax=Rubroshorea leprosula TaxID=152421 RepID=A0AAV5L725_9ROSI|nr:hypothetical protein SLEP1_g41430 [Rubroshorea leprosula]
MAVITTIISAQLNLTAIRWGEVSASKEVRKYFEFPEGDRIVHFEVRDERGKGYKLRAKKRMGEKYPKEVITGLAKYIQETHLVQGDKITISMVDKLFGGVLSPPSYYIRYERAAQGGGNFAGAEAGEN